MSYTNSPLATDKLISPNRTSPRNHAIDTITIHCFVGQVTARRGLEIFQPAAKKASCNYVVGHDGSVGLCVEEKDRSMCSSNRANDMRAVTIEVASDTKSPYAVTDRAMTALIELVADICRRNGKKKILWFGAKAKTLAYQPKAEEMVMTVHRWFAQKSCPGEYLYRRMGDIADKVNTNIGSAGAAKVPVDAKYVYNGLDYAPVFDAAYYSAANEDLRKAFGNHTKKLFDHFIQHGMKEGRQASASFNVRAYRERYKDLQKAYGDDLSAYYRHYIQFGVAEGRVAI